MRNSLVFGLTAIFAVPCSSLLAGNGPYYEGSNSAPLPPQTSTVTYGEAPCGQPYTEQAYSSTVACEGSVPRGAPPGIAAEDCGGVAITCGTTEVISEPQMVYESVPTATPLPAPERRVISRQSLRQRTFGLLQLDHELRYAKAKSYVTAVSIDVPPGGSVEYESTLPDPSSYLLEQTTRAAAVVTLAQHIVEGYDKECIVMYRPADDADPAWQGDPGAQVDPAWQAGAAMQADPAWQEDPDWQQPQQRLKRITKCVRKRSSPYDSLGVTDFHLGLFGAVSYQAPTFDEQEYVTQERWKLGSKELGGDILYQAGLIATTDINRLQLDFGYRQREFQLNYLLARAAGLSAEEAHYAADTYDDKAMAHLEFGVHYAHRLEIAKSYLAGRKLEVDLLPYVAARYAALTPTVSLGAQLRFGENLGLNYASLNGISQRQVGYSLASGLSWYGFLGAQVDQDLGEPYRDNSLFQLLGLDHAYDAVYSDTRVGISAGLGVSYDNIEVAAHGSYTLPTTAAESELGEIKVGVKATLKY